VKCEVVTKVLVDSEGLHCGEVECGRPAQFHDGCWMCFTCARAMADEGDVLSAAGQRRFREIERVVASLPS
jgi:hypothetical protein